MNTPIINDQNHEVQQQLSDSKGKTKWMLVGVMVFVVLVLVVLLGYGLVFKQSARQFVEILPSVIPTVSRPATSNPSSSEVNTDWLVYQNAKLGLQFSYPKNSKMVQSCPEGNGCTVNVDELPFFRKYNSYSNKNFSVEIKLRTATPQQDCKIDNEFALNKPETREFNGRMFNYYDLDEGATSGMETRNKIRSYVTEIGNYCYRFAGTLSSFGNNSESQPLRPDLPPNLDQFYVSEFTTLDAIMATVKINVK